MRIGRWRHPSLTLHLLGLVQGIAEIADGCVTLCSLGFFVSDFEISVSRYRAGAYGRHFKRKRDKEEKVNPQP